MGRLTEVFDSVQNGIQEIEQYNYLDMQGDDRETIKKLRKDKPIEPKLFE